MGEIGQLDFYIQQNQNLGRHCLKHTMALEAEVKKLRAETAKLKDEVNILKRDAVARDELEAGLVMDIIVLDEELRLTKADVTMLTIYGEMLHRLLMDHLNPAPVPQPDPNKEYDI